MELLEAIRTTRAMRRLDINREVSDDDLLAVIDAANRAPSGGNRQPVRYLVVRDRACRRQLGEIYRDRWNNFLRPSYGSAPAADEASQRILKSGDYLGAHFGESPAIIAVCTRESKERPTHPGEIYPAIQNLMLAARGLGLGTTLTTAHLARMQDVRVVLGMPETVKVHALIPIGYPLGRWGEGSRRPAREITYWNSWPRESHSGIGAKGPGST